jgi:hypothetical protein
MDVLVPCKIDILVGGVIIRLFVANPTVGRGRDAMKRARHERIAVDSILIE